MKSILLFACAILLSIRLAQSLETDEERSPVFQTHKINLLWEKAQRRLGADTLRRLYEDLELLDRQAVRAHKASHHGRRGDAEGLKERVGAKFVAIMDKYEISTELREHRGRERKETLLTMDGSRRVDRKLNKLWKEANRMDFSDEELESLRMELMGHQNKLDEYTKLKEELNAMRRDAEIGGHPDRQKRSTSTDFRRMQEELKTKWQSIQNEMENFRKIHHIDADTKTFSEARVGRLWDLARKAGFGDDELSVIKEELLDFERQIRSEGRSIPTLKKVQSIPTLKKVHPETSIDRFIAEEEKRFEKTHTQFNARINKKKHL